MLKRSLYFITIFLFSTLNALTLEETIQNGIFNNSEISSNNFKAKASKIDIQKEKANFYPTLDLNTYYENSKTLDNKNNLPPGKWEKKDGYKATLTLKQLLYDASSTYNKVYEKEYKYKSELYKSTYKNNKIIIDIIKSYTNIVKNIELSQILKYNQEAHAQALDIAYNKEEISGETLERKKIQAMITVVIDKKLLQDIDTNKAIAKFKKLTHIETITNLCKPVVDTTLIPTTLQKAIDIALQNNLKIKEQLYLVKKQKKVIFQKRSAYKPKVTLKIEDIYDKDLALSPSGVEKKITSQIQLDWNFFSGGKDLTTTEREKYILLKTEKTLEKTIFDIKEKITNLYQKYMQTKKRITNFNNAIKINREILDIINQKLQDGTKTFIDVLLAQSKVLESQSNTIKQEFNLYQTYYELLNELSILKQSVFISKQNQCHTATIKNLIKKKEDNIDESLAALLDDSSLNDTEPIVEDNVSNTILNPDNNITQEKDTTPLPIKPIAKKSNKTNIKYIDNFNLQLANIFYKQYLTFNLKKLSATIEVNHKSFTIQGINHKYRLEYILDSFSKEFLNFLYKYKDKIDKIKIKCYTSSEYRKFYTKTEQFNANLALSQRRANKVKKYFANIAKKNNIDSNFVNKYFIAAGKGSINLIKNADGTEDRISSRRIVIQVIKKEKE